MSKETKILLLVYLAIVVGLVAIVTAFILRIVLEALFIGSCLIGLWYMYQILKTKKKK